MLDTQLFFGLSEHLIENQGVNHTKHGTCMELVSYLKKAVISSDTTPSNRKKMGE